MSSQADRKLLPPPSRQSKSPAARPLPIPTRPPNRPFPSAPIQPRPGPKPDRRVTRSVSDTIPQASSTPEVTYIDQDPDSSVEASSARTSGRTHRAKAASRSDRIFGSLGDSFRDEAQRIQSKNKLCSKCREIPFASCLSTRSRPALTPDSGLHGLGPGPAVYITELKHILKMKGSCPCCDLLLRCVRKPENDLFRPEHIRKYLSSSGRLGDVASFDEWVDRYSRIKRIMGGEEAWPFGYTADQKEAAQAMREAESLFESAEERDLHASRLDDLLRPSGAGLADALNAATFGLDLVNVVDPELAARGGRVLGSTRLLTHQMAVLLRSQRSALPCCFVTRAYRSGEEKGAVVSVRVFAHGRGPRAALREICHFSLRFEAASSLRRAGRQIWYGRPLRPTVDVEFFQTCLTACEELHHDVCGKFRWRSQSPALGRRAAFSFRLVDVTQMCVIETDFEKIILPQWRCPYVTLSYTWGSRGENHIMLTASNLNALKSPGALDSYSLPETVKDAIEVVRRMSLRYLWVDRLCIPQRRENQEEHPDNPANIANMGRIYGEALFTIVAGSSQDMDQGLSGMRPGRSVSGQIVSEIEPGANLFLPSKMPLELDTWESRAWTFQEKLLSRRMLIFSGGFAVWHCRCAVWREDVNALDGDVAALSFPWPDIQPVDHPDCVTESERFGLRESMHDQSTRLFRGLAFHQYVQCVEDFSRRDISDSRLILNACQGILRVLGSPKLLNSPFTYGLPTRFIDAALLWQPRREIRRRTHQTPGLQGAASHALPSWSWAGWEELGETSDPRRSFQIDKGSRGAGVTFASPFDVRMDDVGMLMSLSALSEERIRPWAHILYAGSKSTAPVTGQAELLEIGLLGESWIRVKDHQQKTASGEMFKDWECRKAAIVPSLPFGQLTDRNLVLSTQVASLSIGGHCFRVQRLTVGGGKTYCRESLEESNPLGPGVIEKDEESGERIVVLRGRWILDAETQEKVGTTTYSGGVLMNGNANITTKAIVLSEAQYLGNEMKADILGYPLYNIMLIEFKTAGFAERIGLGMIYKSSWKRAQPSQQTIVLG